MVPGNKVIPDLILHHELVFCVFWWKNYHNSSAVKISKWTILGCWNFIPVMSYEHHGISNDWQLNCVFNSLFRITIKKHQSSTLLALYWNKNVIILMKFSSLATLKTFSVTNDENFIKITFSFHCLWEKCFHVMMSSWLVYFLELNHTEKHFLWDLKCEYKKKCASIWTILVHWKSESSLDAMGNWSKIAAAHFVWTCLFHKMMIFHSFSLLLITVNWLVF